MTGMRDVNKRKAESEAESNTINNSDITISDSEGPASRVSGLAAKFGAVKRRPSQRLKLDVTDDTHLRSKPSPTVTVIRNDDEMDRFKFKARTKCESQSESTRCMLTVQTRDVRSKSVSDVDSRAGLDRLRLVKVTRDSPGKVVKTGKGKGRRVVSIGDTEGEILLGGNGTKSSDISGDKIKVKAKSKSVSVSDMIKNLESRGKPPPSLT